MDIGGWLGLLMRDVFLSNLPSNISIKAPKTLYIVNSLSLILVLLPPMSFTLSFPLIIVVLLAYAALRALQRSRKVPLPPGPPSDPIIGHLRLMLQPKDDAVFFEWHKLYGMVSPMYSYPLLTLYRRCRVFERLGETCYLPQQRQSRKRPSRQTKHHL